MNSPKFNQPIYLNKRLYNVKQWRDVKQFIKAYFVKAVEVRIRQSFPLYSSLKFCKAIFTSGVSFMEIWTLVILYFSLGVINFILKIFTEISFRAISMDGSNHYYNITGQEAEYNALIFPNANY